MEEFQAGGGAGVGERETPNGGDFGILAFADHLHAHNTLQERVHVFKAIFETFGLRTSIHDFPSGIYCVAAWNLPVN